MNGAVTPTAGRGLVICCGMIATVIAADLQQQNAQRDDSADSIIAITARAKIEAQAEARIRKAMQTRVTREFFEAPLNQVVQILAADAKIPAIVDAPAFEEEGLAPDEPIHASFRNATLEQALDRMLEPLQLTWVIENEALKITTEIQAIKLRSTRVYNVRKLLAAGHRDEECVPGGEELVCGLGVVPCLPGCDAWLPDLIQHVTKGRWQRIEGQGGTITLANDLLVVRQSREVHDEVAALLAALEAFVDGELPGKAMAVGNRAFSPEDAACYRALEMKVSVDFIDTALKDVAAYLEEWLGVQFAVDERSLQQEGIQIDAPINLKLEDVTAHAVLENALDPLFVTFLVEDGVVKVLAQSFADKKVIFLYDVRDLAEKGFRDDQLIYAIQNETFGPWQDTAGRGGSIRKGLPGMIAVRHTRRMHSEIAVLLDEMRRNAAKAGAAERKAERIALDRYVLRFYPVQDVNQAGDLQEALTALIAPETWTAKDSRAAIRIVGNTLVIRQTLGIHNKIAEFIQNLRAAQPSKNQGGVAF